MCSNLKIITVCWLISLFCNHLYMSCSRLYRLLFMYKICRFLSPKFKFPITFFSIGPIYMIFMGDREQVWNFWTPTPKRVKRVKKGQNLKFCKKVEIFHFLFFFQKVTLFFPFLPFLYFFQRNGQYKHFLVFFILIWSPESTLTLF